MEAGQRLAPWLPEQLWGSLDGEVLFGPLEGVRGVNPSLWRVGREAAYYGHPKRGSDAALATVSWFYMGYSIGECSNWWDGIDRSRNATVYWATLAYSR